MSKENKIQLFQNKSIRTHWDEDIQGSKDAFRIAFKNGLVSTDNLMKTVKSRQLTSHSYNEETASEIYDDVRNLFYDAFKELADSLATQKEKRGL